MTVMKVDQAIQGFLDHGQAERNLSDRTLKAYESDLLQFHSHLEETGTDEVTNAVLENYVEKLSDGPYRDTSVRRKVAALKIFFRYLEEHGFVEESPAKLLKIRKPVQQKAPNILSTREIRTLLQAPKQQIEATWENREASRGGRNRYFCAVRDDLILELLFTTGIRIGELVSIDVGDVDIDTVTLRITGRGERSREVSIGSGAVKNALQEYIELREERELSTSALFVGRSNTRLTIYSIENIFKKHAKLGGIRRRVTPHSLRHTMAAMLVSGGTDIRDVQELLGHASILSTQVYAKLVTKSTAASRQAGNHRDRVMLDVPTAKLPIRKK
jgi:integrase/recombinase XerD